MDFDRFESLVKRDRRLALVAEESARAGEALRRRPLTIIEPGSIPAHRIEPSVVCFGSVDIRQRGGALAYAPCVVGDDDVVAAVFVEDVDFGKEAKLISVTHI